MKTMQKPLEMTMGAEYVEPVTAKSVAGFDSLNNVGGCTATSLISAVFLRLVHSIALLFGRWCAGGLVPAGAYVPVCQPAHCRPFAFDSAGGGLSHLNVGAKP